MAKKPGRNDSCRCGSGKKYKNCCQKKDDNKMMSKMAMIGVAIAVILGLFFLGRALSGSEGPGNCPPGTTWSEAHQHCH